jgi:diaminopimelate epimerase
LCLTREGIAHLCDRHRGVGADGLLAVEPAESGADARMRYYNRDGGEAEMCGNGARCFARFLDRLRGGDSSGLQFETMSGIISAELEGDLVTIELSRPTGLAMNQSLVVGDEPHTVHSVNTGVPHAVVAMDSVEGVDLRTLGAGLRYHSQFAPAGTNVNIFEVLEPGRLRIRTYERGVEDETLACGTGMAACAIVYHELTGVPAPISLRVAGGDVLSVSFAGEGEAYRRVRLTGPADFTFSGEIDF